MGLWVAGPAAAGILADWGADVVRIEPAGDPMRAFFQLETGSKVDRNPPFDVDNRGKRSVVLDVEPWGRPRRGVSPARRRRRLRHQLSAGGACPARFDPEALTARFPRLVYASITGYGRTGPERDRLGYDVDAFWARSGVARTLAPDDAAPPLIRGGFGDHVTAIATVAGGRRPTGGRRGRLRRRADTRWRHAARGREPGRLRCRDHGADAPGHRGPVLPRTTPRSWDGPQFRRSRCPSIRRGR